MNRIIGAAIVVIACVLIIAMKPPRADANEADLIAEAMSSYNGAKTAAPAAHRGRVDSGSISSQDEEKPHHVRHRKPRKSKPAADKTDVQSGLARLRAKDAAPKTDDTTAQIDKVLTPDDKAAVAAEVEKGKARLEAEKESAAKVQAAADKLAAQAKKGEEILSGLEAAQKKAEKLAAEAQAALAPKADTSGQASAKDIAMVRRDYQETLDVVNKARTVRGDKPVAELYPGTPAWVKSDGPVATPTPPARKAPTNSDWPNVDHWYLWK